MTTKTGDQESPQASASQLDQPSVKRAPPPETPAALQTRFRVIAAFWAVIIFLGFPIWWKTTSIYRASLPIEEMVDWADGKVRFVESPLSLGTWWMLIMVLIGLPTSLSFGNSPCDTFDAIARGPEPPPHDAAYPR
jgi:hypothetical protein